MPRLFIDAELEFSEISEDFFRGLSQFQPFGPENMSPLFVSTGVFDSGSGRMVGSSGEHLKLDLCQECTGTRTFPAIAFSQANHFEYIKSSKPFDICYSVEVNDFRGMKSLQLNIRDIKPSRSESTDSTHVSEPKAEL
jgi:single-stranded-DNA-specific exonuclease